jgi:hypothetical protein
LLKHFVWMTSVVSILTCIAFLAGIWSEDDRWFFTGILGSAITFVLAVITLSTHDMRNHLTTASSVKVYEPRIEYIGKGMYEISTK